MAEFLTLPQAIERYVADGKSVALEGSRTSFPMRRRMKSSGKGKRI